MQWKAEKVYIKSLKAIYNSKLLLNEKVESDLYLYNSSGAFSFGKTGDNVKWGLYHNRDIYNLIINGQKPSEIVELTMDGEKAHLFQLEFKILLKYHEVVIRFEQVAQEDCEYPM